MNSTEQTPSAIIDEWSPTRSGRYRIRLHNTLCMDPHPEGRFEVYILDGHELLPRTRTFTGPEAEQNARAYANAQWKAL